MGYLPIAISIKDRPSDHISDCTVYLDPCNRSGAIYERVPTNELAIESISCPLTPKSHNLISPRMNSTTNNNSAFSIINYEGTDSLFVSSTTESSVSRFSNKSLKISAE